MKKAVFSLFLLISLLQTGFAQKISIKNVFGSDSDELGDYDLYSLTNETDETGTTETKNIFSIGDRFQFDYSSKNLDGRFRLDLLYNNSGTDNSGFVMAPTGFILFRPVKQLSFVLGNDFFKTFAIKSAYLAAADDTTKYGRLLINSLGNTNSFSSGGFTFVDQGFAGGISTNFVWGKDDQIYLNAAFGSTIFTDYNQSIEYSLDTGANFGVKKLFDTGFTAHNFLSSDRKFGVFAGLNSIPNLILNTSFYYNFTLSDYLPEARVNRSEGDEFKKQKTLYALGLTAGYLFKDIGFGLYGDVISGLNDEYIGEIKYYDNDDNLIDSVTSVIKRGSTVVKYKYNSSDVLKAKRTDEYTAGAIPFYSQLRFTYDISDILNAALNIKFRTMINDISQTWLTFYPRFTIELPKKCGEISSGIRIDLNLTRYNGVSSFSVPLTYTYKFKKDFSK